MITSVSGSSSYSTYTRSTSSDTTTANSKKFAEDLLKKLDTNGDGSIGKDELSSALSSDPKDGIAVSLSKSFGDLDSNDDDSLDADELAAMTPPPPPPTQDTSDLFSSLDTDSDGSITATELTNALQSSSSTGSTNTSSTNSDAISSLFSALDADSSGGVSASELSSALKPNTDSNSGSEQNTSVQATEALNRMVAALSNSYNLNSPSTSGKYVSTSA